MSPAIGIGIGIPFNGGGGISWAAYWTSLISATVENAAPTDVVLTFPVPAALIATDITATVNGVARIVSSASWTGAVWTVVLASAVEYGDVVVMTFVKTGGTAAVTNNVLTYAALLTSIDTGAGISTLRMRVSADITVTLGANAKFYTDAGGTLPAGGSATWTITSGALRTIYLKCTTGTATMSFSDASKIIRWGDGSVADGWTSGANAAMITIIIGKFPLAHFWITGSSTIIGALPTSITAEIYMVGNNIYWTNDAPLLSAATYVVISGVNINWTGLDLSGTGNITVFNMGNYRIAKMSSADMITLLTSLTNKVGTLPAAIIINDYLDWAAPPVGVTAAVDALKIAKSITTVTLGA